MSRHLWADLDAVESGSEAEATDVKLGTWDAFCILRRLSVAPDFLAPRSVYIHVSG